jgi:hypothetical protein
LNLDLPGGTINEISDGLVVGKREKRFDSSEIYLPLGVKFIDMLEKTKF